jgi:hypothetical protein
MGKTARASAQPTVYDDQQYRTATDKLGELLVRHDETERQLQAAIQSQRDGMAIDGAVASLLDTGAIDTLKAAVRQDDIDDLRVKLRVIGKAIEVQNRIIEQERRAASQRLVEKHRYREQYTDALKGVHAALVALETACTHETRIRDEVNMVDGLWLVPPNPWRWRPGAADNVIDGRLAQWLLEARSDYDI